MKKIMDFPTIFFDLGVSCEVGAWGRLGCHGSALRLSNKAKRVGLEFDLQRGLLCVVVRWCV